MEMELLQKCFIYLKKEGGERREERGGRGGKRREGREEEREERGKRREGREGKGRRGYIDCVPCVICNHLGSCFVGEVMQCWSGQKLVNLSYTLLCPVPLPKLRLLLSK